MSEMINPYIAGAPVTEPRMFFGREDVFGWVERSLPGRYVDHILVIHGQRRVGKTSVLKQLHHRLPDRYIPVFFDLQGRTHTSVERLLWWLAREITRALKQDRDIVIPMPKREDFAQDPEYLEAHFLPSLRSQLPNHNVLLTFDEFDALEEADVKDSLARPLIDYLKRLTGQEGLSFIFSIGSSGRKLENMRAAYTEFFKAALYREISFLSRDDTRSLITQPVEGVLEYTRKAVDRIYWITSGHPYFTQLVCHELFSRFQRSGERRIAQEDVEAVLTDVVERGTVNLKFVWDEASDLEKWVLASLARMDEGTKAQEIASFLQGQRVRFSPEDLDRALLHLREKDVLTDGNGFVIHLLRIWLDENRPLERVREELIEVNPIANRYIEIGQEYRDIGAFDKAVDSFLEALKVDPDNVRAQVNIASVRLDEKAYEQAAAEYEKALGMDDEDVAARAGLCQAHLALGDVARLRNRVKDAIRSYQHVLSINAQHTEARQRMADIHKQDAEQAVSEGRFAEAFESFREALEFTPEDGQLESRFEGVREKHRETVVESLKAKAREAQSEKLWDQAIAHLEESQELAPEDKALAEMLADVREAKRQNQLEDFKREAQARAAVERWDEALASWHAYLALDPEDRESAEAAVQQIEASKKTSDAYAQARQAMAGKDYDRAVGLLKGIILEDETYKDASRLLAEAIDLRRAAKPFWKNKWLWGAAGVFSVTALAVALLAGGILDLSGLMGPATITPAVPAPSQISTPEPTPMTAAPTSTAAPTPIPLSWTRVSSGQAFTRDTVTAIVIDPDDPEVLYVGTQNAGIYKSIDAGTSWQPKHSGLGRAWILSLVIDPRETQTLYAGVSTGGVYKTSDGGESWREANFGLDTFGWGGVAAVVIDPQDSQHLFFTPNDGIYETHDGGESWSQIAGTPLSACFVSISFHPLDSQILFAVARPEGRHCPGGVFKSEDGGQAWEGVGLQDEQIHAERRQHLAIDHRSGELLYAATAEGLYGSRDGGGSWQRLTEEECLGLAVSPEDGNTAHCVGWGKLVTTTDGGDTWTDQDLEQCFPEHGSGGLITVSPHDANTLVFGGQGVCVSKDAGGSWIEQNSGLGATRIELQFNPAGGRGLFLLDDEEHRLFQSLDEGRTWSLLSDQGSGLAFDADGSTLYRAYDDGLVQSQDGGLTWDWSSLPTSGYFESIAAHPTVSQTVYALYVSGNPPHIYFSEDAGVDWEGGEGMGSIPDGRLYFDHDQGQVVYAIGDWDTFRSEDGGKTWQVCELADAAPSRGASRLVVDLRNSGRLILATRGVGVLRSEDGCRSWQVIDEGLGNLFVNTVAADPDTIYAGTDSGAYVSFDLGEHWGEISDGLLGARVVYSIVVDPDNPARVFAATPYGIFRMEGWPTSTIPPAEVPAPEPTPEWPSWMNDFAVPLLDMVRSREPDFEDDLSGQSTEWGSLMPGVAIHEGVLTLNTTEGKTGIGIPEDAYNYVLEFDLILASSDSDEYQVEVYLRESNLNVYKFVLRGNSSGLHEWGAMLEGDGITEEIASGSMDSIKVGKTARLVFIVEEDEFAVLLNGAPLCHFFDNSHTGAGNSIYAVSFTGMAEVHIDNVTFWNLDPGWVQEVALPMLEMLDAITPVVEAGFNRFPTGLVRGSTEEPGVYIDEGVMKVVFEHYGNNFLDFFGSDLAIAFEFSPHNLSHDPSLEVTLSRDSGQSHLRSGYFLSSGGWRVLFQSDIEGVDDIQLHSGNIPAIEGGAWAEMMVIWWDQHMLLLIDGRPLALYETTGIKAGYWDHHEIQLQSDNGEAELHVDNLRYWDLSEVEPFD